MTKGFFNKFFYLSIFLIIFGITLLFIPQDIVKTIFIYVVSVCIILTGYYKLVMSNKKALGKREYYLDIVEGFVCIFVGVINVRFFDVSIVCFIIGLVYLVVPLLRIFLATNKINQILMDIFKFIFAGFILMNNMVVPKASQIYVSVVFILFGLIVFAYCFLDHKKNNSKDEEELF